MGRRKQIILVCMVLALLGAGVWWARSAGWLPFGGQVNPLGLDLSRPDALLTTQSLAALPRDVLKQPMAKRLLSEDLAFYYESHEDRLGVLGAIKRIAYEHELNWSDELLRLVLDEPAQVALWRDGKGALRHYAVAIRRNKLAALAEQWGKLALSDAQLRQAGEIKLGLAGKTPLLALTVSPRRTFLFASAGDRLVLLSDAGMLLDAQGAIDKKAASVVADLLDGANPYAQLFAAPETAARHRWAVNAQTWAFGYQRYFPTLEAFQIDLDDQGQMQTALLVNPSGGGQPSTLQPVLASLPAQPALCALLPIDWASVGELGQRMSGAARGAVDALALQADGSGSACWYGESQLHTPVFAAGFKDLAPIQDAALSALFDWAVRPGANGAAAAQSDGATAWRRTVAAPYSKSGKSGGYPVALVRAGNTLVFSPDQTLAERVAGAAQKRFPSVADSIGVAAGLPSPITVAVLTPSSLAQLLRREADALLPAAQEPHLRAAARRHLWPQLDELAKLPAVRITVPADAWTGERGWRPLSWQPLS
jgi:uncharacterized protein YfaA (DUF2138 family)